mgnify:CR=1 FL=1
MGEAVDNCVQSILEDNPEMDEDTAWKICKDMDNRGVLKAYLNADPTHELVALAEVRNAGDITRVEKDGGVVYKRVMLLAPGIWTDAGSRQTIEYAGEAIRKSADQWVNREINLLHGPAMHNAEVLGTIGEIVEDSIVVDDQDRMFGDLYLSGDTPASELGIELMDETLEAAQDPKRDTPPVGPSVEISDDVVEFDENRGLQVMQEMTYAGLGIVFNPASRPAQIGEQVRERAVAMSDGDDPDVATIRALDDGRDAGDDDLGGTLKGNIRHPGRMGQNEREQVTKLLAEIGDAIEDVQRVLQTDEKMAAVQDLIAQYIQADGESGDPVTEMVSWVDENTDMSQGDIEDVLEAYLDAVDAESLEETPVAGLQDWIDEMGAGEGEGEEDGEGDDDGDGDGAMSGDQLQQAKQTIAEFSSHLEDVKDMLQEDREAREDLEDNLEDLERRLSSIEDEPNKRSLSRQSNSTFTDEDEADGGSGSGEHEDVML